MRSARKLWLVAALALAAAALAAGPAYATTINEVGTALATENGNGNLNNGVISITCTSSDATATLANSGATSIDALTFGGCTNVLSGAACTVTVTGLPQAGQTTFVAPDDGDFTTVGPPFAGATVDCGALTCTASSDNRLTATVTTNSGASPRLNIVNQPIGVGGDTGCGIGIDGNWNSSWTVNWTSVTGTTDPVTGEPIGTDTTLTITA
jgi:hypothetical protein